MNPVVAMSVFAVGSAALALWTYVRFPRFAPSEVKHAIGHIVAALVIAQLVATSNVRLELGLAGHAATMAHVFILLLPILVYSFLSALWMFALLAGAFRAYGR